jgi:rhodanese-related sulfurtransferase
MHPLETDCQTVKQRLDNGDDFLFIDCREQQEYDHVRIDGAKLIPMSEIPDRVSELETHREGDIVIHCHHGGRSLNVANWLKNNGFNNPLSMAGGIDQWAQEIDTSLPRY